MKRLLTVLALLCLAVPALAIFSPPSVVARATLGQALANAPISEVAMAQGAPDYLGTYDATTTSKTNAQATNTFGTTTNASTQVDLLKNKVLLLHNAGAVEVRILPVSSSTGVVTTTRSDAGFGVSIGAGEKVTLRMPPNMGYLAVITASSTANVDVWEMK